MVLSVAKNWIECKNNINKYTSIIAYKTKKATHLSVSCLGAPEGTRTPDLLIRSQTLYPAELPAHILLCVPLENVFYYSVIRGESQPFFSKNFEKKANGQLALNFAGQGRAFRPFVVDCWGAEN